MVSSVAPSAARRTFSKPKQTWGLQHQSGYSSPRPYITDSFAASSPRASLSPSASTRGPLHAASSFSAANYLSGVGSTQRLSRPADCVTLGQNPPVGGLENGLRGRSLRRTSHRAKQAAVLEGPQQMSPVMSPGLACRADAILPPAATSAQRQYRPSTRNLVPSSQQRRGTVGQSRAWTLKQLSQSGASAAHSSCATMQPAREVHLPFQSSLPLPGVSAPTIPMAYQPRQTVPLDAATQRSLSPPFFGLRQEQPLVQRSYDFSLLNDALNGKEPSYSSSAPSFSLPQQRLYSSGYSIQLPVQVGQATPPHMGSPVGVFGPIAAQSPRDYALDHQVVNRSPRATFPSSGIPPTRDSHCNVLRQFSAPPLSRVVVSTPSPVQRSVSYHPNSSIKRMCSGSPVVSREASAERPFSTLAQRAVVISTSEAACSQDLSKLQTTRTFAQTKKATEFTHSVQRQASSPPAYPASGIHRASPKNSSPDSQLRVVQRQFSAPPLRSEYATWILGCTSQPTLNPSGLSTPNCSGAGGKLQPNGLYDAHSQKIFVVPATERTQPKMKASPLPMAYRSANIDLLEAQTPQPAAKDDLLGNEPTNAIPAKLDCGNNEAVKERAFRIGSHSVAGRHPPFQWTNQDEHVVIQLADHLLLAAVFDGHGQAGHLISSFVKQVFEQYASDLVLTQGLEPHDALLCLFRVAHQGLKGERELAWVSGSTASAVIIDAKSGLMTSAHAGDSRVLLVDGSGIVFETVDHVITAADEERMLASGGEVREEEHCGITSRRIFERGQNLPGLAMARSLGDLQAQSVGTLSDPEIHQNIPIGRRSTVVVATDGIWDKLSTSEVREFLAESDQDLQQAAVSLVDRASACWTVQTDVDDITAVLIRLPVLDYDIGDTGGTGEISVLDIPNDAPIGTALGNGTDDNNVTNSSLLDSPETLLRAQEVAEFMQHGVVPIDASMASIHETALLVQSIGEALGTGISQADGFLSRSDLQATVWIEMDGLPAYEGEDINIATLGILRLEQIKAVCESNPDCVGFAYCTAGNGRWCPKKIGTGFHPLVATYSQKHPGEFWKWYYIRDRTEALGDFVTQESDFATVQLASVSSFTPIAASESSTIPKPPVITTEAQSLDAPRLQSFTFDTTQSTSPNPIDADIAQRPALFTFDAADKEEHALANSTLAAVATAAMTQPQPHDSPRVDAKQFREVDIRCVPAPRSWRDLTPTGPVRSLLAPGPFLDDDGTTPVLAPFPSPVPVGAAPKFTSGAGMPSLAAVAMATVTPNPSPLVNTSVTPVPVPRKLESFPQIVSSPSGWENAVDAAAVRSPSWSMQNKPKQADSLSSQFVQQVPADGVRQAPSPVDELQWRRWVTGVGTPPRV